MKDSMGTVITELRTANIASERVRGEEPAPARPNDPDSGDVQPKGKWKRFVVLSRLGAIRQHRAPVVETRIGVRAYGVTYQDAAALYGEISDALDNAGPRLSAQGVAIYQSLDETGGSASKDPDTGQPVEDGVIAIYSGTDVLGS